jgi:hypothetical protein
LNAVIRAVVRRGVEHAAGWLLELRHADLAVHQPRDRHPAGKSEHHDDQNDDQLGGPEGKCHWGHDFLFPSVGCLTLL